MNHFDWQTWIAIAIVLLAASVLSRRIWQWASGQGKSGCGSCPSRGQSNAGGVQTKPLVQISSPKK